MGRNTDVGPMPEPSDPSPETHRRRWGRPAPHKAVEPELRNAAVFTDSRVEIEIDDETGKPQLRIVRGARRKE